MTVIDLLRNARPGSAGPAGPGVAHAPSRGRLVARGALTALASLVLAWLLALVGWLASGQSTVGLPTAIGMGTDGWLLAHGGRIDVGQAHIALTPLLAWAGIVLLIARSARWVAEAVGTRGPRRLRLPRDLAGAIGCFALGYAGVVAAAALVTFATPARADALWVLPAVLLTLVVGVVFGLVRSGVALPGLTRRFPVTVLRALPAAGLGAVTLLGVGAVLVLVAVVVGLGGVTHVTSELGPGLVGGLVLLLAQALALPNLALWAVSFLGGSGFQVVAGQPVDWSGAHSGLLPMIPVLAALPAPGVFPWAVRAVVLVPVLVGVLVGRRALASVARLSRVRTKAAVAAAAAVGSAVALGALDLLGGGSLGAYRLGDLGAPALLMTAFLAAELTVGALGYVAVDAWRLHRRR